MNNRLNKIILLIFCQCFLSAPFTFASQTEKAYGENLITEGDVSDLDGIALGLVASALSSCAGVAPDSNAIKVAGSNYLSARISNYKNLKDLQKKIYKYERNAHNVMDVNDVQKYSITAEQYKDNLKLVGILEDSLVQQKAFKSSLSVARGIASTNIHQMKEHLTLCIVDIYYAAWHEIIYTEPKIEKFPGICGLHGALVGYAADVYCPAYLSAKSKHDSAPLEEQSGLAGKVSSTKKLCVDRIALTEPLNRHLLGTPEQCISTCKTSANAYDDCRSAMKALVHCDKTISWDCSVAASKSENYPCGKIKPLGECSVVSGKGITVLNELEKVPSPSTDHSEEMLNTHHSFFTNMYRKCGRASFLKELDNIKSLGEFDDNSLSSLKKHSEDVAKEYGGGAYTKSNRRETDDTRLVNKHYVKNDHKANKFRAGYDPTGIRKESVYNSVQMNKNPDASGRRFTCSDPIIKSCGSYSKMLMKSLNSCTKTIRSTIDSEKTTFHKLFEKYRGLFISDAKAIAFARRIGEALGYGQHVQDTLSKLQNNMISGYDPLLSTYNKRIVAYDVGIHLMDRSIINTQRSIDNIKKRLEKISLIKTKFSEGLKDSGIIADVPTVPEVDEAKGTNFKMEDAVFKQIWSICDDDNCNLKKLKDKKIVSSANLVTTEKLEDANKDISSGTQLIADIGKSIIQNNGRISKAIKQTMNTLGQKHRDYTAASNIFETQTNLLLAKNKDGNEYSIIPKQISNDLKKRFQKNSISLANKKTINQIKKKHIQKEQDKYYTVTESDANANANISNDKEIHYKKNKSKNNKKVIITQNNMDINAAHPVFAKDVKQKALNKTNHDISLNINSSLWEVVTSRYNKVFSTDLMRELILKK